MLAAAKKLGVPMAVAQATRDLVQRSIEAGHTDCDFGILLEVKAKASGMDMQPENVDVSDGLRRGSPI